MSLTHYVNYDLQIAIDLRFKADHWYLHLHQHHCLCTNEYMQSDAADAEQLIKGQVCFITETLFYSILLEILWSMNYWIKHWFKMAVFSWYGLSAAHGDITVRSPKTFWRAVVFWLLSLFLQIIQTPSEELNIMYICTV